MSNLKDYAEKALEYRLYDKVESTKKFSKLFYLCCGLGGETGELLEKVKKIARDKHCIISDSDKELIAKELGDIHWYWSALCFELGVDPDKVLDMNLDKIQDRLQRDVLRGSGDER